MNYKKTEYGKIGDSIYNLHNWTRIYVTRKFNKETKENENLLIIEFGNSDRVVTASLECCKVNKLHVQLGIPEEEIEQLFLEFEVKDD